MQSIAQTTGNRCAPHRPQRASVLSLPTLGPRRLARRVRRLPARFGHAAVAALVVLLLGFLEPLACVLHCQLFLPLMAHHLASAGHTHAHLHASQAPGVGGEGSGFGAVNLAGPAHIFADSPAAPPGQDCFHGGPIGGPGVTTPAPYHEMALALALVAFLFLLLWRVSPAPPGDPPPVFLRPPLRPPISLSV